MNFDLDFSNNFINQDNEKIKKEISTLKFNNAQLYKMFIDEQKKYAKLYQNVIKYSPYDYAKLHETMEEEKKKNKNLCEKYNILDRNHLRAKNQFNKYYDMYIEVVKILAKTREKKRKYKIQLNAFKNKI